MRPSPGLLVGIGAILAALVLGIAHLQRTGDDSVITFVTRALMTGTIVLLVMGLRMRMLLGVRALPRSEPGRPRHDGSLQPDTSRR